VSTTNAQSGQSGTIDNLRFIRSDLKYKTRLRLRQTDVKHPFLPSGSYRLSVFVRQDTEAGSGNVFAASRISLGINQNWVRPNGTPAAPGSFIDDTAVAISADPGWGNWTEVSVVFRNVQIDPPSTAEDYNIELTISATDSSSAFYRDCGSILISSPALEFLPDE
jgi:hypothetical protein